MINEKNISTLYRIIATLSVVVFIALFVIPLHGYATSYNNINFGNQPFNIGDTIVYNDAQTELVLTVNHPDCYFAAFYSGSAGPGIFMITKNSSYFDRGNYTTKTGDNHYYWSRIDANITINGEIWYCSGSEVLVYNSQLNEWDIPYYDIRGKTVEQYLSEIITDIDNTGGGGSGGGNVSTTLNYNLPAGNVAYIEIGDGVPNISMMSTIMPVKSSAFSSETGWNSTQRVGFAESLPSSGDNLASFGNQIEWIPDGNTNIFGQTQNAKFTAPSLSGHKYLVVVNPLYYAIQYTNGEGIATTESGVNSTVNNNSVNIFMNYSKGITVFQLTQNVTINNNIPTYSNDVSSGPYEGDIDPDTGDVTWTDPDGGSSQPTTGGGNVPGTGENNFSSFLSGVANRIVNVFQPAHDAILTLSNAVQNIAGWMYALYIWLPAPVLSILTSAISLAIIIGLIKVFV